uniref:Uncharacterized protein n=2 Tax=Sus scrofa TaxID=9823 RepID=A0A8D0QPV9_PIG
AVLIIALVYLTDVLSLVNTLISTLDHNWTFSSACRHPDQTHKRSSSELFFFQPHSSTICLLSRNFLRGPFRISTMKLFYLLIIAVFFISQVIRGYEHGKMAGLCDLSTGVCLRRKKNCIIRMPGICPGRSFCCVRTN